MKRVGAFLLSIVLGACFLSTEPQSDLVLSIQLSTTHVRADSGLTVTLTVLNPTSHDISLGYCPDVLTIAFDAPSSDTPLLGSIGDSYPCGGRPAVDQAGQAASASADTEPAPPSNIVPAGGSVSRRFTTWFEVRDRGPRYPAGDYRVRGMLWNSNGDIASKAEAHFGLACRFPDWTLC